MNTKIRPFLLGLALAVAGSSVASAYTTIQPTTVWLPGSIPFQIRLGTTPTYGDGSNPSTSVQAAMNAWNAILGTVQFLPTIAAAGNGARDNDANDIFFTDKAYGEDFGDGVLAVTLSSVYPSVHERAESDILFNTKFTWSSYRGAVQTNPDIRRVAMHELGHSLGLDHPDDANQTVVAVMNSHISSTDALTADDIAGGQSLYYAPGPATPQANDNFSAAVAIVLTPNTAQVSGANIYGTKEGGEPNHATEPGGKSSWWTWTAPSNGSMTITTDGSRFDTVLGVYTGGAVNALTAVASNDDTVAGQTRYSTVTFNAVSGTTYRIAVDGWQGESGFIMLNLSFTPTGSLAAPIITSQPANVSVASGATAQFTVAATGTPTPTYRWQYKVAGTGSFVDVPASGIYSGTASSTLSVVNVSPTMNGDQFRCVVTNSAGSATSNAASLSIAVSVDVGRLLNLSVRTFAGTGSETLLVGLVIGGNGTSGAKPALIRGIGPTLAGYGVANTLADPNLELIAQGSGATLVSNNDWGGNAQVKAAANAVGAFALPSDTSKDSALYTTQSGGVYSVKITGVGNTTGIALAEVYDATPASSFTAATPRLINVSARTQVGTGDSILIAGFVIGGSTPCRVLIRGIGPTLTGYGVPGALANPKLQLYQNVAGADTLIGTNDDWNAAANASAVVAASTQVGAFSLDASSKDAVILATLSPGIYSAQVSGVGNTTGIALVEIYEVP